MDSSLDKPKALIRNVDSQPFGKFHEIGGAPPETFPNIKYDASEEMGGDRQRLPEKKGVEESLVYEPGQVLTLIWRPPWAQFGVSENTAKMG